MEDLILEPGPHLLQRQWTCEEAAGDGHWVETDVAERAHEFLFDLVAVAGGVTLGDVFRLLEASPVLKQIFRRDFADELCDEVRKGPDAFRQELKIRMDEIESGAVETIPADEVFRRFDHPATDAMFDTLGGLSPHEVWRAVRDVGDDDNVAAALAERFGCQAVVKAQFRDRAGKAFRKAFRAAGR